MQILDSSPVALPPVVPPRPLKRSASNASLPPTPPRTHRKLARGRSRGSCDSDSDDNALLTDINDEDEDQIIERGRKKRRIGGEKAADADEEAFWLGNGSAGLDSEDYAVGTSKAANVSIKASAPLLYRRLIEATDASQQSNIDADVALASPPPSNRKSATTTPKLLEKISDSSDESPSNTSTPRTPKTRSATRRALLDSPGNPFLDTPSKDVEPSPSVSSANPSPHTPESTMLERPVITYVFRGVRREYANPLYDHAKNRPLSPRPESKLPINHPEFSPSMHCTPKMLFPEARAKKGGKGKNPAGAAAPTLDKRSTRRLSPLSDDEDDGHDEGEELSAMIRPKKLNFGVAPVAGPKRRVSAEKQKEKPRAKPQTLDQELKIASKPLFL